MLRFLSRPIIFLFACECTLLRVHHANKIHSNVPTGNSLFLSFSSFCFQFLSFVLLIMISVRRQTKMLKKCGSQVLPIDLNKRMDNIENGFECGKRNNYKSRVWMTLFTFQIGQKDSLRLTVPAATWVINSCCNKCMANRFDVGSSMKNYCYKAFSLHIECLYAPEEKKPNEKLLCFLVFGNFLRCSA